MIFTSALAGVFILFFAISYITARRFGVLCLALIAGSLLAKMWVSALVPIVSGLGFGLPLSSLTGVLTIAVTIAPAFLLLFSGPTSYQKHERAYGAIVFAVLGVMFVYGPFVAVFSADDLAKQTQAIISSFYSIIVSVCIALALLDVLTTHARRGEAKGHKK